MTLVPKLFVLIVLLTANLLPRTQAAEFYTEDLRIPMAAAGPQGLEAFLVRPAAARRYPLALLGHGTPRDHDDRPGMTAHKYYAIALEFARRGFAALVVLRRGYGTSPGDRVDSVGPCARAAYLPATAVAVADLRAAIDAMSRRNDVTTSGMIAVGHSSGGLAIVGLAAQAPPGLIAAISFAGGRGSSSDDTMCNPDDLVQAFATFGKTARVPMLWVYAANDHYFPPALAHRFYDAFRGSGGNAKFVDAPAHGEDGHYLYSTTTLPLWTPLVDAFLRERGIAGRDILSPPDPLPIPAQLSNAGKDEFLRYLASVSPHKAAAVSPKGAIGWRSGRATAADAQRDALAACGKWAEDCSLYAVDDRLATGVNTARAR